MSVIFGAIDIGASSGRVIAGSIKNGVIQLHEVHRFPNGPVDQNGTLVWEFPALLSEVKVGLSELANYATEQGAKVVSIGIDTWAVDYGLLRNGELLANPNSYRDPKNQIGVEKTHSLIEFSELYQVSGLQFLPFNTIYQLVRQQELNPDLLEQATDILMIPDLIGFFLTGQKASEKTNASSTGLFDAKTRNWSKEIAQATGLTETLEKFAPLRSSGEVLGALTLDLGHALNGCEIVLVGSHDTASAVVGVPATSGRNFAFISSGTWSLLGSEIEAPILSEASRKANFTNELGVSDRIRYLKNLSGLWLLAECLRDWGLESNPQALFELLEQAKQHVPDQLLELDDESLIAPGDMVAKISRQLDAGGHPIPKARAGFVALILHSLAASYAENLTSLEELAQQSFDSIYVVGGGSQNELLSQLTANYSGKRVICGPVEATAIGNLVVQMQAAALIPAGLGQARKVIANSFQQKTYEPEG